MVQYCDLFLVPFSVGMPLCRRWFDLSDTALSALGLVSKILGLVWLGFSVNKGMLFVGGYHCLEYVPLGLCFLLSSDTTHFRWNRTQIYSMDVM